MSTFEPQLLGQDTLTENGKAKACIFRTGGIKKMIWAKAIYCE